MAGKRPKAIALISGGLDSILAVKVLQQQGVEIIGVTFTTPFFGPRAGLAAAEKIGISLRIIDISKAHLEMLKNPRYGYGSQINPCIDCHALMLREAGKLMEKEEADFLVTGEVLGQRPMSQRKDSLRSVDKLAGYPGLVVRPLSAKLLPPTIPEQENLIDRNRLLDIQGRSRKRQIEMAMRFGIKEYPQPGGGCMLTKEGFSKRLRMLFQRYPDCTPDDVEFLKWGRSYLLPCGTICIIGRNKGENAKLSKLSREQDTLLEVPDYPAPKAVMLKAPLECKDLSLAASILVSHSDAPVGRWVRVICTHGYCTFIVEVEKRDRERYRELLC